MTKKLRVLLPKVVGSAEEGDLVKRPGILAEQYQDLVRRNLFDLVGQTGVACKPPSESPGAANYAFAYKYPGTTAGADWGDESLKCGADGWYLSVEDLAQVLLSINARDNRILTESSKRHRLDDMRTENLGWDVSNDRELEKNRGYGANCDSNGENCAIISTSAAIFGPVRGPNLVGVLFINSNISGGPNDNKGAKDVLETAYHNSLMPK